MASAMGKGKRPGAGASHPTSTIRLWSWEMLSASEILRKPRLDEASLREQDSVSLLSQFNNWNERVTFLLPPFHSSFLPLSGFILVSVSLLTTT